jgi:hypothetical protein
MSSIIDDLKENIRQEVAVIPDVTLRLARGCDGCRGRPLSVFCVTGRSLKRTEAWHMQSLITIGE